MNKFISTFEYKLIYVFRINDEAHEGLLKIGDTTVHTDSDITTLAINSRELNLAAKKRINEYTSTAGVGYELLHTELAIHTVKEKNTTKIKAFQDKDVHRVLLRSGIKNHIFNNDAKGREWFNIDLETAKNAIHAVKSGLSSLSPNAISVDNSPIIFRPEQEEAIKATVAQFKKSNRMLWNAKMRFGKTLSALEVAKRSGYKKTLIFTHRPVVSAGWYEDFIKIFNETD
ncbi:MAG: DEAD/DEAH box helicase, partial [Clostridia bacterium]